MNHYRRPFEKLLKCVLTGLKLIWLAAQLMYGLAGEKRQIRAVWGGYVLTGARGWRKMTGATINVTGAKGARKRGL